MFLSTLLYSDLLTTDYSCVNDLIGQLKNFLLQCPQINVISDNNPPPNQARVIILKIGNSNHFIRIYGDKPDYIRIYIRNLTNTSDLSGYSLSYNNVHINLLYGANNIAFGRPGYITFGTSILTDGDIATFLSDAGGQLYVYLQNENTHYSLGGALSDWNTEDNKTFVFPAYLLNRTTNRIINNKKLAMAYSTNNRVSKGRYFKDETNTYYVSMFSYSTTTSILIPDK